MNMQSFDPALVMQRIEKMPLQQLIQQSANTANSLKKDPRNFQLLLVMAMLQRGTGETLSVVNHLKKALKLQPRSEFALKMISEMLMKKLGKHSEALKYLKKWQAVRTDKDAAIIWACIAECHIEMDNVQKAIDALDKAKQINPDLQRVYLVSSTIYSKMGDLDKAMEDAQKAFDMDPNEMATAALSVLPNFGKDKASVDKVAEVAEGAENPKAYSFLHGVAAGGYEKLGDYEKAFQHLQLSNKLRSESLDRDKTMVAFQNLRETFSAEFLKYHADSGHKTNQPIFIVGMPRSGTTLTESILAGHPNVIDNGELQFLFRFADAIGLHRRVDPMLRQQLPSLQSHFHAAPPEYMESLANGYMDESGFDKKSKKMQVDKLPHNFMMVGLISIIFPNAKIIHCRRHPVDCALSCYRQTFKEFHTYATDLEFLGLYYRQYWELMKYWRAVLPNKMHEVYYEDTVANTELVARNMIEHLELEWDDACLDHTAGKKTVNTASQWQVRQPIYTSSVAKWKHYEQQLQPMIKAMGSCVEEYETELANLSS